MKKLPFDFYTMALGVVVLLFGSWMTFRLFFKSSRSETVKKLDSFLQKDKEKEKGSLKCGNTNAQYSLLFFYMSTCSHCIEFKPEWQKVRENIARTPQYASKICLDDVSAENDDMISKYKIDSFPTLYLVSNNSDDSGMPIRYEGSRTYDGLMTFISQNVV